MEKEVIRDSILRYFDGRNEYGNDFTLQEVLAPTFEQIYCSSEVQSVINELPEDKRQQAVQNTIDLLVDEGVLDNNKFPGGYSYLGDCEINARNFMEAVRCDER